MGGRWILAVALSAGAAPAADVAAVPETLKEDPAYTEYARILVQLELLAEPALADAPITVDSPLPGVLDLRGSAPTAELKQRAVDHAARISGLRVRENLRVIAAPNRRPTPEEAEARRNLEPGVRSALAALFPELADGFKVTSAEAGVVVLEGQVSNMETRLMLSQTAKGALGCRAVRNRLRVTLTADETPKVRIGDGSALAVFAAQLPRVPDAPGAAQDAALVAAGMGAPLPLPAGAADDAPAAVPAHQQLADAVRSRLAKEKELASFNLDVEAADGLVTLVGSANTRQQVELAVAAASEAPHVVMVVAKTRPVSIQRYRPFTYDAADGKSARGGIAKAPEPKKLLGFLPLWGRPTTPNAAVASRKFRESLRHAIQKMDGIGNAKAATVKASADGHWLLVEGVSASPQQRAKFFKELENLPALRNIPYDAVVKIEKEAE